MPKELQARTAAELAESQARLAGIVGSVMDAIITVGADQRITLFNSAAERMFGYTAEMMLGQPLEKLIPERFHAGHPGHMQRFGETGVSQRTMGGHGGMQWGRRATGQEFPIEASISQVEVNGQKFFTAIVRDATQRLQAEQELADSRAQLAGIVASAMDAIITIDESQLITLYNAAAEKMFGYRAEIMLGQPLDMLIPDRFSQVHHEHIKKFGATGVTNRSMGGLTELTGRKANGIEFPIEASISQITIAGRKFFTVILRDLTTRLKAEDELRESQQQYKRIVETTHEGIWLIDKDNTTTYVNPRMAQMLGYAPEEMFGRPLHEFVDPAAYRVAEDNLEEQREGAVQQLDYQFLRKDGSVVDVLIATNPIFDEAGEFLGSQAMCTDITDRKRAEEALRESQAFLEEAQEITKIGNWSVDLGSGMVTWSEQAMRNLGLDASNDGIILGDAMQAVVPEDVAVINAAVKASAETGASFDVVFRVASPEGEMHWIESKGQCVLNDQGKAVRLRGVNHDITERVLAEKDLRTSQLEYKRIVETSLEGIWVTDEDGRTTYVNPRMAEMLGCAVDEMLGKKGTDFMFEEDLGAINATRERFESDGTARQLDLRLRRRDGSPLYVIVAAKPTLGHDGEYLGALSMCMDISDRKFAENERAKLEQQFLQAQKMEAIGTLAGGIAHDFNNILAAIRGFGELVLENLEPGSQDYLDQQEVLQASERASQLVRQILTFSRKTDSRRVLVSLPTIVKEVVKLMRATLPATIEVLQNLEEKEAVVTADPIEIHQILVNLCTNAGYAMQEDGGVLEISLRRHSVANGGSYGPDLEPGDYYLLGVADTGQGIPRDLVERIFEPFFTTKEAGEGTGLGLSTVHGVVQNLGGKVTVYSEPGQGTTFHVYLPASEGKQTEEVTRELHYGTGRILLVDDEVPLAKLGKHILEDLGYIVHAETSSITALSIFQGAPDEFDIVVTDETMPKLKGTELAKFIAEIRPELPVILCTGFGQEIKNLPPSIKAVLHKPVSRAELSQAVHDALELIKPSGKAK